MHQSLNLFKCCFVCFLILGMWGNFYLSCTTLKMAENCWRFSKPKAPRDTMDMLWCPPLSVVLTMGNLWWLRRVVAPLALATSSDFRTERTTDCSWFQPLSISSSFFQLLLFEFMYNAAQLLPPKDIYQILSCLVPI